MILSIDEAISILGEHSDTVDRTDLVNRLAAIEKKIERGSGYVAPAAGPVDPQAKDVAKIMLRQSWDGLYDNENLERAITYNLMQLKAGLEGGGVL